jgi:hypothetical protein
VGLREILNPILDESLGNGFEWSEPERTLDRIQRAVAQWPPEDSPLPSESDEPKPNGLLIGPRRAAMLIPELDAMTAHNRGHSSAQLATEHLLQDLLNLIGASGGYDQAPSS